LFRRSQPSRSSSSRACLTAVRPAAHRRASSDFESVAWMSRFNVSKIEQRRSPFLSARSRYAGLCSRIHFAGRSDPRFGSNGSTSRFHRREVAGARSRTASRTTSSLRSATKSGSSPPSSPTRLIPAQSINGLSASWPSHRRSSIERKLSAHPALSSRAEMAGWPIMATDRGVDRRWLGVGMLTREVGHRQNPDRKSLKSVWVMIGIFRLGRPHTVKSRNGDMK